jgi:uncharacterized protein (TIGR00251 family)
MRYSLLVSPSASTNSVLPHPSLPHTFLVKTTAPATDNKANLAVIKLFAQYLGLKKSQLDIVSGLRSKQKIVAVI